MLSSKCKMLVPGTRVTTAGMVGSSHFLDERLDAKC